jgi:hypothetical protein
MLRTKIFYIEFECVYLCIINTYINHTSLEIEHRKDNLKRKKAMNVQ